MRVLVIGYGFIGQGIYKGILERGVEAEVLSPHLSENPANKFWRGKIQDIPFINELNLDNCIIIHTAHVGYPLHENDTLSREIEENLQPLVDLLEHLKDYPSSRLIYISSGGAVYGEPTTSVIAETHPRNPISYYGLCKKYMEEAIKIYHKRHNLSYDILRPANVYDTNWKSSKKQGVISALVDAALNHTSFQLWGDGKSKKDYIHLSDVVDVILRMLEKNPSNTEFNLSTNKGYSINELIKIVEERYGRKIKIEKHESKNQDVKSITLDNSKLRNHLSWSPDVEIR